VITISLGSGFTGAFSLQADEARTRVEVRADPHSASAAACPPLLLPQASFAFLFQSRRHVAVVAFPSPPPRRFRCRCTVPTGGYRDVSSGRFPGRGRSHSRRPTGGDLLPGPKQWAGGTVCSGAHHQPRSGRRAAGGRQRPLRFCPPLRPTPQLCVAPFAVAAAWGDGSWCSRAGGATSQPWQWQWPWQFLDPDDAGKRALAYRHAPMTPSHTGPAPQLSGGEWGFATTVDAAVPVRARRTAAVLLLRCTSRHATKHTQRAQTQPRTGPYFVQARPTNNG
jgi:hypothetical protein